MKKVIVGSKNPVKIEAVKLAFEKMFPNESFEVLGISIPSNVSDQPMTSEETYTGALNRAKNCMVKIPDADFTVGLEGGLTPFIGDKNTLLLIGWVAVLSNDGTLGQAGGGGYPIPSKFKKYLDQGLELGDVSNKFFKKSNVKQTSGTIGILTHGAIDRTTGFMNATIQALIPHANKELYKVEE